MFQEKLKVKHTQEKDTRDTRLAKIGETFDTSKRDCVNLIITSR